MSSNSNCQSKRHFDELAKRLDQMNVDNDNDGIMSVDSELHQIRAEDQFTAHDQHASNIMCDEKNTNQRQSVRNDIKESNILIVTNLDLSVFTDPLMKSKFESLFKRYDPDVTIRYLKSFKRIRLDFSSEYLAEKARTDLDKYALGNSIFRCFLARIIRMPTNNRSIDAEDTNENDTMQNTYLNIPKLTKQFLISPPASPPIGWEPVTESSPCIDVQLISRIANLVPGQVHEIHAGSESQPGIFVEVCEEAQFETRSVARSIPRTPSPCVPMEQ